MRYRIEYEDGRRCNFANSRKDLLDWLKALKDELMISEKCTKTVLRILSWITIASIWKIVKKLAGKNIDYEIIL